MLYTNIIITDCIESTKRNVDKAVTTFSRLSDLQLNWKPAAEVWSAGECINHLVTTNNLYLTKIEQILNSNNTGTENAYSYTQSLMGKMIAKAVNPANVKKSKTFKVFLPDASRIKKAIVEDYINTSTKFIDQAMKMNQLDLRKVKLSSPVNFLIRLNLGDVLIIIPKHDERHLNQAERLLKMKNFFGE